MLTQARVESMMQQLGIDPSNADDFQVFRGFLDEAARDFSCVSAVEAGLPADAKVRVGYDLMRQSYFVAISQRVIGRRERQGVLVVIPDNEGGSFSPVGLATMAAGYIQQRGGFNAVARSSRFGESLHEVTIEL